MNVLYAGEELTAARVSIFLAGPTPRRSEVPSWRPEALGLLRGLGFAGTVPDRPRVARITRSPPTERGGEYGVHRRSHRRLDLGEFTMSEIVYLFDIDGTLVSAAGAGKAALTDALAAEFGIAHTLDRLALSGRTDRAIIADLFALCGLDDSDHHRDRLIAAYLRLLPATLASRPGRVLPGVPRLLDRLAETPGVAVGLITGNGRHGARIKLGHFGLWERFAFGGYGDRHADRDDVARDALAAVERHLGRAVDPGRVRVVGDSPHDVRCARAIGGRAVGVLTGWHDRAEMTACAPDLLLDDLSDHEALLGLG